MRTLLATLFLLPSLALVQAQAAGIVGLHVQPRASGCAYDNTPCSSWNVQGSPFSAYDVYLVVQRFDGAGVTGLSCGLLFDEAPGSGIDLFSWTLCADSSIPAVGPNGPWPQSGSGIRVLWDANTNCPGNQQSVAGSMYMYAYGDDYLDVNANPIEPLPEVKVSDCSGIVTSIPLEETAYVRVTEGGAGGCTPCNVTGAPCGGCYVSWGHPEVPVLDFGDVAIGESAELLFLVEHAGGVGSVLIDPVETCPDFEVFEPTEPVLLEPHDYLFVRVRFTPTTPGLQECTITTACGYRSFRGTGTGPVAVQATTWGAIKAVHGP